MLVVATILRVEGISMLRQLTSLTGRAGNAPVEVRSNLLRFPFFLRPGENDVNIFINNVIRQEYGQYPLSKPPRMLVDAGACIGDTAAYFLTIYPDLRVIAIEPNEDNARLASLNLAPYGDRVTLLSKALAGTKGHTTFSGGYDFGSIGSGEAIVETINMETLLSIIPEGKIDVLKMDIEGAELDVFEKDCESWIHAVDSMIVELHGPSITERVCEILRNNGFEYRIHRSLHYFRRSFDAR